MVARTLLDLDEPQLAFEVCDRDASGPSSSEAQVDAAFHAGWIALRFLDDAPSAAKRFALAAEAAENPLSVARAAYWQGRAAEAMGDFRGGQEFLRARRERADRLLRPARRATSRRDPSRFPHAGCGGRGRSARRGGPRGRRRSMPTVLTISRRRSPSTPLGNGVTSSQLAAMAEVVKQRDDTGTQVQFAKIAVMQGHPLDAMAFPAVGMPAFVPLPRSADLPTVYAVARQESEFIWHASSGAGAKGLMQMLPSTAVVTARRAGVEFDYARLIVDPRLQHPARRGASGSIDRRPTRLARTRASPPTTPVRVGSRNGSRRMAIRATERSISSTGSSAFPSTRRAITSKGSARTWASIASASPTRSSRRRPCRRGSRASRPGLRGRSETSPPVIRINRSKGRRTAMEKFAIKALCAGTFSAASSLCICSLGSREGTTLGQDHHGPVGRRLGAGPPRRLSGVRRASGRRSQLVATGPLICRVVGSHSECPERSASRDRAQRRR